MEKSFWLQVLTASIAVLAFIRPEIAKCVRRWTNRLGVYPSARVEIGFSGFGPTVGLSGSLVALHNDQLVTDIKVTVTRLRDNATHVFEWVVFRSTNVMVSPDKAEFAPTSAFTLKNKESKQVNIQFHDIKTRRRYEGPVLDFRASFQKFVEQQKVVLELLAPDRKAALLSHFQSVSPDVVKNAATCLHNEFYWETGQYLLSITVMTGGPELKFEFKYDFALTQADVDTLKQNFVTLLRAVTIEPNTAFNFAWPAIEKRSGPRRFWLG
jgi:hypothetical protein